MGRTTITPEISYFSPGKDIRLNSDGSITGKFAIGCIGTVRVFTFPGDDRHREFTSLEMDAYGVRFHGTLSKFYHRRWLSRLARQFAHECRLIAVREEVF